MLTIQQIQENISETIRLLAIKGFDAKEPINRLLELDTKRKSTQKAKDDKLAESNLFAKEIGMCYKNKEIARAEDLKKQTAALKDEIKILEDKMSEIQAEIQEILLLLPNLPHPDVPEGESEEDNVVVKQSGEPEKMDDKALPHWEIADKSGIIDFKTGTEVSGAGFPFYVGKGAKLQRALIAYFLDTASEQGFTEIEAPILVNEDSAYGTGQLPDKDGQMYFVNEDNMFMIPTAEVPLTNMYRGKLLNYKDLPVKMCGYTPCFRREAGSYGKNVRGLNRLHQFDKVEIVQIQHPDKSYQALDEMVAYVESLVKSLGLTYRILKLCGKDISFTSALTYDFEVWSAAQKRWLEVSSVSNFESFQANRMKLRFKDQDKKNKIAHTLNGSALALPRIVAAILENYQHENYVEIPEVLKPYTRFDRIEF